MRTTSNGRTYRSKSEWDGIFERYEQSGLSAERFCTEAGVAATTFQKRLRKRSGTGTKFVELKPTVMSSRAVEVRFADGTVLRIEH